MIRVPGAFAAALLLLAACDNAAEQGHAMGAPPPPLVGVVEVQPATTPLILRFAGRITGLREVEIRARVGGILLERTYKEGAVAAAGDVLFKLDPQPYQIALDRARAQLVSAQAVLAQTRSDWDRVAKLFGQRNVSARERDKARADYDSAQAAVSGAKAEVEQAEVDLGYTTVTAPISGATGVSVQSEGSLVGTTVETSLLTRVTQVDPVYVNFFSSGDEAAGLKAKLDSGRVKIVSGDALNVKVMLDNGQPYGQVGRLDFTDNVIEQTTGTLRLRATMPNPNHQLLPGQFVRVILDGLVIPGALVIPQRAVTQTPQGAVVYVVGADNIAEARPIVLAEAVDAGWVVTDGLKAGDKIVVDGIVKVHPGAPVAIAEPPPAGAASGSTTPGATAP